MLSERTLRGTEQTLRGEQVLSVYIDGRASDPADRGSWRVALKAGLTRTRDALAGASHSERSAFDRAARHLDEALGSIKGAIGADGLMAFATPGGVARVEMLPVPVAPSVQWGRGALIAPALRALKESRPAIVAIVDSRSARLYRYRNQTLEPLETKRAVFHLEPPSHMGAPPRVGFHSGTRGRAGTDATAREREVGRANMMRETAERVARLAGAEGWVLLGGTPGATRELATALPERLSNRMLTVPEFRMRSTDAELVEAAAKAASGLRRREDAAAVRALLDHPPETGRAAVRLAQTRAALDAGAVRRLYVTTQFIENYPDAEAVIRDAFAEGAAVEIVSGEGGELLDAWGGVGALLRFPVPAGAAAPSAATRAARGRAASARRERIKTEVARGRIGRAQRGGVTREASERRESGAPGGGAGRRDIVGPTSVYPASGGRTPSGHAEVRTMAAWGQGERGAAGYEDSGGSELSMYHGQLVGGLTAGPSGEPTIDIHGESAESATPRRKARGTGRPRGGA